MIMQTYTIEATKRIFLQTTIQANSLDEAQKIADEELITPDFEEIGTDFTITFIA